ncbi:MAG: ABC transporter substrate-binding protein [Acidobacteriota bacterium]
MTWLNRAWVTVASMAAVAVMSVPATLATSCGGAREPAAPAGPRRGGALVATSRSEPRTFNPIAGRDFATHLAGTLMHARLLRINRATQQLEPALAERYSCTAGGLTCTLILRQGVTFSDGTPFTSADVLFTFRAVLDGKTGSSIAGSLMIGGKPVSVAAPDPHTIVLSLPAPYGPGLRFLDSIPILPKHKLESALDAGTLRDAWSPTTSPAEMTGLGPFVLQEYKAGERLVYARNPRYWKTDGAGAQLPYLDRLTIEVTPEQNTELLRLQSGQADLTQSEIRAEDYAVLKREADAGKLKLIDAGLAFDSDAFWFNLKTGAKARDPRRAWLQSVELRRAVSLAVNRKAFVDSVFLGAAEPVWGPVSPSNTAWYAPDSAGVVARPAHDPGQARVILAGIGLRDTNNDGMLEDKAGRPVRFSIITQKGNTTLEKGAAAVRDDLQKIGIAVDLVPLEVGALVDRMLKADYDALYFRLLTTDTDPAMAMDFWLSSGGAHVWNMAQERPATEWEAEIDALMRQMAAETDLPRRQQAFRAVQEIFSNHLPVLYFAVPRLYVATSTRVAGATPAPVRPPILWNPEVVAASAGR